MTTPCAPCPLCAGTDFLDGERVAYPTIWAGLTERGAMISAETQAANTPSAETVLMRCTSCALDVFQPLAPGDQAFYESLMATEPYVPYRWDFAVAASVIRRNDAVIDLGCGEGVFLDWIEGRAQRRVGIDLNTPAIARLRDKGVEAEVADVRNYARAHAGEFDVVTSLQTLEHLDRVVPFGEAARRLVRSGGSLVVAVPNRERLNRAQLEVFDLPPHHVTRWSPRQLRELGRQLGMKTEWVRVEPAGNWTLGSLYFPRVEHALLRRFRPQTLARLRKLAFSTSVRIQRHTAFRERRRQPHHGGHSLVAKFRVS